MCVLIILLVLVTVFARYIYNIINNYILETKRMYFYSSVLDINGRNFSIQNWDGYETYTFTVDLRNYKNGCCFDFETLAKELYRVTKEGGALAIYNQFLLAISFLPAF